MHPNVRKKYEDNNIDIYETASDANEKNFLLEAKNSPIKREIVKIIRLRKGGIEYFYWHEEQTSRNYLGNRIHYYKTVGYYKDPEFAQVIGSNGQPMATEIEAETDVYEYKWPDGWNEELEDLVSDDVDLIVITKGRKYGGFSFQDFKDRTFDELVTLGKYGTLVPKMIEVEKKRQSRNRNE